MGAQQRRQARERAREEVGFSFGFFAVALPVPAILAGAVGVVTGLVTPIEALTTVALMALLLALLVSDHFSRLTHIVFLGIVNGTAAWGAWLEPVPLVGTLASFLGNMIAFWYPVLVLVIIAWLL